MNKSRLFVSLVGVLVGVALFIFGGYDDSPGAQLLGLVVVIASIVGIVKSRRV